MPEARRSPGSPTVRRRELGAMLRALRNERSLTVDQVAATEHSSTSSNSPSYSVLSLGQTPVAVASSLNQAAVVDATAPTPPSGSTTTSVATDSSVSSSSLLSSFVADVSHTTSVAPVSANVVRTSTADSGSSNSDLLLLDQTWSNMDNSSFDHDDESLYHDESRDIMSTNDLALAAVLKDDDEQWNTL